jgi:DHA2 family multidrug resistance protein-like MFS transporter
MTSIDLNGLTGTAAQAARETIGGAIHEAAVAKGAAGELLVAEARSAYASAFQTVNIICAVVAALAGLVAAAVLGRFSQAHADCPEGGRPKEYAA